MFNNVAQAAGIVSKIGHYVNRKTYCDVLFICALSFAPWHLIWANAKQINLYSKLLKFFKMIS